MSFITRCPYCKGRVRLPGHAHGHSVTCPRCGNAFTVARPEDRPEAATGVLEKPRPDAVPQPPSPGSGHGTIPAGVSAAAGALALLLAGLAVPGLSFARLRTPTMALAGGALAAALFARLTARPGQRAARAMPLAAAALAVPALLLAGLWPTLLGTAPPLADSSAGPDPAVQLAIPVGGGSPEPAPRWADAERYSLQQGDLRVRVTAARLQGEASTGGGSLEVELRIYNVGMDRLPAYRGWGRSASGQAQATLGDPAGKTYSLIGGSAGRGTDRTLAPFGRAQETLVFAAPPGEPECLYLELSVGPDGPGRFGFCIPRSMIARR
jgi:hypothetical protein